MTNNIEINSSEDITQINSWDLTKLKYVCKVENGSTPKSNIDEFWDDSLKWFTPYDFRNITNNFYLERPNRFISQKGLENSGCSFIKEESILLTTRAPVGKVAKIKGGFTFNQGCKSLSPKNLDIGFLYYSLQNSEQFLKSLSRGTTFKELSTDELLNFKIHIPELKIQKRISKFLDKKIQTIDNLIKKIEKKIELLKEKKITLINQCVTKGLKQNVEMKDSGVEWIGEIPKHWIISRIKFHSDVLIGLSFDKDDISEEGKGTLVLRSSNVLDGKVSFRDNIWVKTRVPEKLRIKNGDILVCSRNGSRKLIGKNCILGNESEGMTWGVFMTVLRTSSPKFFYWILNSQLFKSQSGIYLTSTINQLTVSNLQNMVIPFPPDLNEQNEINIFLEKVSGEINQVIFKEEKRINLLKEYRQSLITSVVTGKKRVV